MSEGWKSVLFDYVRLMNEKEWLHDVSIHDRTIPNRWHNIFEDRMNRHCRFTRSESKLRILEFKRAPMDVEARIQVLKTAVFEEMGQSYSETQLIHELVRLQQKKNGDWQLVQTVRLSPEHRAHLEREPDRYTHNIHNESALLDSRPFINRSMQNLYHDHRVINYDRAKAVQYAEAHWDLPNPNYPSFEVDCTNFISQCLAAGGAPMKFTNRRNSGWWFKGYIQNTEAWSYSWSVANSLRTYVLSSNSGLRAEQTTDAKNLQLGDLILYDWNGDGRYQHSTIVTGFTPGGEPLVNARSTNSRMRYWRYLDSPAWTSQTHYVFLHLPDVFVL